MMSVSNIDRGTIRYNKIARKLFKITDILKELAFSNSKNDILNVADKFMRMCNFKINIVGKQNIFKGNKVIISNHCNYIDVLILYIIFGCPFLASSMIKSEWFGRKVKDLIPLLTVKRGKNKNTVKKMRKIIKELGSIGIFPEGMITNNKTLIKFRSGAFNIGYPIQPVIIKYSPYIYDGDIKKALLKILSQDEIIVTVKILPKQEPPFEKHNIRDIRYLMAYHGNFALSRVTNKDIVD